MVTGNEYIFGNIDEALNYVLDTEQRALKQDEHRQTPPTMVRAYDMKMMPVDSLDYPLSAWFNNADADKFVMTRLYHYNDERTGEKDHEFKIHGSFNDLYNQDIQGMYFLLTMGDMTIRCDVIDKLTKRGGVIPTIVHPSAHISRFATIAEQGGVIGDRIELQNDVIVEKNVIIRSDVTVCHNTTIKEKRTETIIFLNK